MSSSWKTNLLKYGISSALSLVMVWLYIYLRVDTFAEFAALEPVERNLMLCDACTVPGVLLLMFGCLVWLSNEGALDGLTYAVTYAVKMLIPLAGRDTERYSDYVARKRKNKVRGYGFLFIVGGVFLIAALLFMGLFYALL